MKLVPIIMNTPTSFRSFPSNKSVRSHATSSDGAGDFELCLIEIFKRYNCPVAVAVGKEYKQRGENRSQKNREGKLKYKRVTAAPAALDADSIQTVYAPEEVTLRLIATYDNQGHLTELKISEFRKEIIPRITLQLLSLIINNYQQLNKFMIKNSRIDNFTVHELGKILTRSTITEICLDDCPLGEANYEVLLKHNSCLKNLSLCRCRINDEVCQRLASKLHFSEHAGKKLVTLNLSSNDIRDAGAKYFGDALRSNRHLRYLNLADNAIGDEGASHLFNKLIKFPLNYDENMARRHRLMIYMRKKHELYIECLRKLGCLQNSPAPSIRRNTSKMRTVTSHKTISHEKRKSVQKRESVKNTTPNEENMYMKAELIARELAGPFVDPFCPSSVRFEDGYPYCTGNFALCYLNIAYNDLTFVSITTLLSVVVYQQRHLQPGECGLMKIILDGNPLPARCIELTNLQNMLNNHTCVVNRINVSSKVSIGKRSQVPLK